MKLISFIIRYGTIEEMIGIGLSAGEVKIISMLPPGLRVKVDYIKTRQKWLEKADTCYAIRFMHNTFIRSPKTRMVVPYYLHNYGELRVLVWQAAIYVRTGFWLEPSLNELIIVDEPDSIKTRLTMAFIVVFAPIILPAAITFDLVRRHSLNFLDFLKNKIKKPR
jgi:hypothetical protein